MNRLVKIALLSSFPLLLTAQIAPQSSIIIGAPTTPWFQFYVDAQLYQGTATFVWPQGSKHILQAVNNLPPGNTCPASMTAQLAADNTIIAAFGGWKDNAGLLGQNSDPVQTITADPRITSITASVGLSYRVTLNFFNGPTDSTGTPIYCTSINGSPGAPPPTLVPGNVFIDSSGFWNSAILYLSAGSHTLNAFSYPGFVFDGWSINGGLPKPYLTTVDVEAAVTLFPKFEPAKRVRFVTNPQGLSVLVDHSTVPTAPYLNDDGSCPSQYTRLPKPPPTIAPLCIGDMEFAPGSQHVLASPAWEEDQVSKIWVFKAFDRGGQNMIYTADPNVSTMDVLNVNYVPGADVRFLTIPQGLPVTVDNRSNWPNNLFVWGLGETHTVNAQPVITDVKGRKYTFRSWSNGGPAAQTITMDMSYITGPSLTMTATYDGLSRLVVQTSPPGMSITVDGTSCQSPCNVDRAPGTQVHLTAPNSVPLGTGSRLDFTNWSDSGSADHVVTVNSDMTLTASFQNMYMLAAASNPSGGATFQFNPGSSDGYYAATTAVTVTATANPGFKFKKWSGDLTGVYPAGTLSVLQPGSVVAQLDTVPYIKPTGVGNSAGDTPDHVVAPGSIIAITGASLTVDTVKGNTNPLSQTLDGVVVIVGQQYLPLMLVSPPVVTAQLPFDLPEGDYILTLSRAGQPDVTSPFTVARNAPGLYSNPNYQNSVASAFHQDNSPVTPDSPAVQGEIVTIYGTGFGPVQNPVFAGFLMPGAPPNPLADNLQIQLGDFTPAPVWSGNATDVIGMQVTRFQITPDMPSATTMPLTITVNGRTSNTVNLPLQ